MKVSSSIYSIFDFTVASLALFLFIATISSSYQSEILNEEASNGAMHKYILVADQRYGGTWLTALIKSQVTSVYDEEVHIEGEHFLPKDNHLNFCQLTKTDYFDSPKCAKRTICLFRLPYFAWKNCDFIKLAKEEQIGFVHIIRRNKIDWLVSHAVSTVLRKNMKKMNLTAAQVMHCKEGDKCYADDVEKVKIDTSTALTSMRGQQALDDMVAKQLSESGLRYRSLFYEDVMLMGTPLLLDFLGINVSATNQSAVTRFKKRLTKGQKDLIENYDEFVSVIRNSEFRWDLDFCMEQIGKKDHC